LKPSIHRDSLDMASNTASYDVSCQVQHTLFRLYFKNRPPKVVKAGEYFAAELYLANELGMSHAMVPSDSSSTPSSSSSSRQSVGLQLTAIPWTPVTGSHQSPAPPCQLHVAVKNPRDLLVRKSGSASLQVAIDMVPSMGRRPSSVLSVTAVLVVQVDPKCVAGGGILRAASLPFTLVTNNTAAGGSNALVDAWDGFSGTRLLDLSPIGPLALILEQSAYEVLGGKVWDAGWMVAECLRQEGYRRLLHEHDAGRHACLELGSGTGVGGIAYYLSGGMRQPMVVCTDLPDVMPICEANLTLNFGAESDRKADIRGRPLPWGDDAALTAVSDEFGPFSLIMLCDVLYNSDSYGPLIATLRRAIDCATRPPPILLSYRYRDPCVVQFFQKLGDMCHIYDITDVPLPADERRIDAPERLAAPRRRSNVLRAALMRAGSDGGDGCGGGGALVSCEDIWVLWCVPQ